MSDVAQLLIAIDAGDPKAAGQLLPLVYDELRKLAAAKMAQEKPGQTLQATALVHEAWLRLAGPDEQKAWNSRGQNFGTSHLNGLLDEIKLYGCALSVEQIAESAGRPNPKRPSLNLRRCPARCG